MLHLHALRHMLYSLTSQQRICMRSIKTFRPMRMLGSRRIYKTYVPKSGVHSSIQANGPYLFQCRKAEVSYSLVLTDLNEILIAYA